MTAPDCIVHVVDDDASWRKSVQRVMTAAGYRVALYESAEVFLENVGVDAPGCILLDLRMSGLSGLGLQQALAEIGHRVPIVFVTGYGAESIDKRFAQIPVLQKPIEVDALKSVFVRSVAISGAAIASPARRMVG